VGASTAYPGALHRVPEMRLKLLNKHPILCKKLLGGAGLAADGWGSRASPSPGSLHSSSWVLDLPISWQMHKLRFCSLCCWRHEALSEAKAFLCSSRWLILAQRDRQNQGAPLVAGRHPCPSVPLILLPSRGCGATFELALTGALAQGPCIDVSKTIKSLPPGHSV
jgi:hypothetical protein